MHRSTTIKLDYNRSMLLALALMVVGVAAQAQVPHEFTAGTPAKASEVNENFAALNSRLAAFEGTEPPEVVVDCAADADALQTAVSSATAAGLSIMVSGTCNAVSAFNKRNIHIDGQGLTTIVASNGDIPLDLGVSEGMFISNLIVDAQNAADAGIIVGASSALLTNVTAVNAADGDGNLAVWVNSVAVLFGETVIGDADDSRGLNVDEGAMVLTEGRVTIRGTSEAIRVSLNSLFEQDTDDDNPADVLTVVGPVNVDGGSVVEIENGSIVGGINVANASLRIGATAPGLAVTTDGPMTVILGSYLGAWAQNGGNVALGVGEGDQFTSYDNSTSIVYGGELTGTINWGFDNGFLGAGSTLRVAAGATISPDSNLTVQAMSVLNLLPPATLNPAQVTCHPTLAVAQEFDSQLAATDLCGVGALP